MRASLCLVGWGVGNFNLFKNLCENLERHQFKITLDLLIIDKLFKDNHGGISYGKNLSAHGYFNNPCRLSPKEFTKWVFQKENRKMLLDYLKKFGGAADRKWIMKSGNILSQAKTIAEIEELYLPRVFYGIWMENKFVELTNKKKIKINYLFIKGEVAEIVKKNNFLIKLKKNYDLIASSKNVDKTFLNKKFEFISISLGVLPPKKIYNIKSNNYLNNFYYQGGTSQLIKMILKNKKNKNIVFLGSKAGFLEPLMEINEINKNYKFKIYSISPSAKTLMPAKLSKKKYELKYFQKKKYSKIKSPEEVIKFLEREFLLAIKHRFNKYDAWTKILKEKIFEKIFFKFSELDKKKFLNQILPQIRSITRFTNPDTIEAKNNLVKKNKIIMLNYQIKSIHKKNNKLNIHFRNNKKIVADIIVDVTGPIKFSEFLKQDTFLKNLVNLGTKYDDYGFLTRRNMENIGTSNIFTLGQLSRDFNPTRKTIISAVVYNSKLASKKICKKILLKN